MLFTSASHYADPGRIQPLREAAAKRGFDRTQWFDDVGLVVSEEIGRETETYVTSINKYFYAYKMITEQREKHE